VPATTSSVTEYNRIDTCEGYRNIVDLEQQVRRDKIAYSEGVYDIAAISISFDVHSR
jgi:hypothetical protein